MKRLQLNAPTMLASVRAELARVDALPPGAEPVSQYGLSYARSAADAIAAELATHPGKALDAWYAAGIALLAVAQSQANVAHQVQGGCDHAQMVRAQANIVAAMATLLIDRSGGLR